MCFQEISQEKEKNIIDLTITNRYQSCNDILSLI